MSIFLIEELMNVFETKYCWRCGRDTTHNKMSPNHFLHLLFFFLTFGLWGLGWLYFMLNKKQICSVCGEKFIEVSQEYKEENNLSPQERLFLCKDCNQKLSIDALFCPHCGKPNKPQTRENVTPPPSKSSKLFGHDPALVIIGLFIFFYIIRIIDGKHEILPQNSSEKRETSLDRNKNVRMDYKTVIEECNKALSVNSNDAYSFCLRGIAKGYLGDYEGAIRDFDESIKINPSNLIVYGSSVYYWRGTAKDVLKDEYGTFADLQKAESMGDTRATDLLKLIKKENRYSLLKNEGLVLDYLARGITKTLLNDYYGALDDLNKCIELDPSNSEAYYTRGSIKLKLNDESGANEDFLIAKSMGHKKADEHLNK